MLSSQMNRQGNLYALLSTARVANIPSVVSNIWLGVAVGLIYGNAMFSDSFWLPSTFLPMAGMFLYVGGNFLNDWMDRDWDKIHRPERGLPRGLFPSHLYLTLAIAMILGGIGLAALVHWRSASIAVVIGFFIVIYTICHKRSSWAVIPMGLCRALLPVMSFFAFYPYVNGIWPMACALLCYIVGLSLSARYESMLEPPKLTGLIARLLLLTTAVLVAWGNKQMLVDQTHVIVGVIPYLAWTSFCLRYRRKPLPRLVSGLLAGIPLVDWMALLPVAMTMIISSGASPIAIGCIIISPLAFIFALFLQRLAPAT